MFSNFIVGDFESFYGDKYSLSSMSTEEYVRDPRFQIIGLSLKRGFGEGQWHVGRDGAELALREIDWAKTAWIAHNARFDAMILERHFGIVPHRIICTMSMARAAGLANAGNVSLARLAERMRAAGRDIPLKGNEVALAEGKRLEDFHPRDLAEYGGYAIKDGEICWAIFLALSDIIPVAEVAWQHHILASASGRRITLDKDILLVEQERLAEARAAIIDQVAITLNVSGDDVTKMLRSKEKFRFVLEGLGGAVGYEAWASGSFGVEPYADYLAKRPGGHGAHVGFTIPTKLSEKKTATLGKPVYDLACAKVDKEFTDLIEGDDEAVSLIAETRLGVSSSISITRTDAFLRLSQFDTIGVPINISGAHTHRMGGTDKINMQNLPSGRKPGQSKALRRSIQAPPGYVLVAADASQIEARLLAFIAQQTDLLELFAAGKCTYCDMAGSIVGQDAELMYTNYKSGDGQSREYRQLGKSCVLGCGYRMGEGRFTDAARETYNVVVSPEMGAHSVRTYRQRNFMIVRLWELLDEIGFHLAEGGSGYFGGPNNDLFYYDWNHHVLDAHLPGIRGPDGLWVTYPGLRIEMVEKFGTMRRGLVYDKSRGRGRSTPTHLHGGKITENITQYLAFALGKWQTVRVAQHYPLVLNEHDAWVTLAREEDAPVAEAFLRHCMTMAPAYLAGVPIACEAGYHRSYGDIEKH